MSVVMTGNGAGRCCLPRHRYMFRSRNEGSEFVIIVPRAGTQRVPRVDRRAAVGPATFCPPHHPTHFDPRFLS
jgi:hypothetical protein